MATPSPSCSPFPPPQSHTRVLCPYLSHCCPGQSGEWHIYHLHQSSLEVAHARVIKHIKVTPSPAPRRPPSHPLPATAQAHVHLPAMLATQSHHPHTSRRDRHPRPSNPHPPAATLAPVRPHTTKHTHHPTATYTYTPAAKYYINVYPRGRSRNVSPVAIARQASEERQRQRAQRRHTDTVATTGTATRARAPVAPGRMLNIEKQEGPSRLPALPRPAPSAPKTRSRARALPPQPPAPVATQPPPHVPSRPSPPPTDASTSSSLTSTSPESHSTSPPTSSADTCHDPLPPRARTLRDEIQDAYAIADTRRARALYLQFRSGVPVALTDPRIESVSEEELCRVFSVPEGLFSECMTITSAESEREVRRRKACERARAVWANTRARVRAEKEEVLRERAKREEEAREHARKVKEVERIEREREERERRGGHSGFAYDRFFNSYGARPPPPPRSRTLPSSPAPTPRAEEPFTYALPMSVSPPKRTTAALSKGSGTARRLARPAPLAQPESAVPFDDVLGRMRGALFPIDVGTEERGGVPRSVRVLLGLCVDTEDTATRTIKRPRREGAVCKACEEAVLPFPFPDVPPSHATPTSPWLAFLSFSNSAPQPSTPVDFLVPPPLSLPSTENKQRHSCGRAPCAHSFIAVDVDASPLGDAHLSPVSPTSPSSPFVLIEQDTTHPPAPEVQKRSYGIGRFADVVRLARTVHTAYIAAMLAPIHTTPPPPPNPPAPAPPLRGVRRGVRPADVRAFRASPPPAPAHPYILAPLRDLPAPASHSASAPRLTPTAAFPVLAPSGPRARAVPNPAHLRVLALAHVCRARGLPWAGGAGPLGSGRERVLGVSAAGRGGSGLRWGWRVVWEGEEAC